MPELADAFDSALEDSRHRDAICQPSGGDHTESLTYQVLGDQSAHLLTWLADPSVFNGGTVAIAMRRSIEHVVAIRALLAAGVRFFSVNPQLTPRQILQMLLASRASLILCDNPTLLRLSQLKSQEGLARSIVHVANGKLTPLHEAALSKIRSRFSVTTRKLEEGAPETGLAIPDAQDSEGLVLFTSGSTGTPKGVQIRAEDLLARARAESKAYEITPNDRLLNVLPFSFDVGFNQLLSSLITGSTLVILNSWLATDLVRTIERFNITGLSAVPALWTQLLEADPAVAAGALHRLRYATVSGGSLPEGKLRLIRDLAPKLRLYKTYGQTETFRTTMLMPRDLDRKARTVGQAVPGVGLLIADSKGDPVKAGEEGEVLHFGVGTMIGYLEDDAGTAAKLREHPSRPGIVAVHTGDRGFVDEDGFLTLLGRMDRMAKIRGNRVYPEEVETCLWSRDDIRDAAVVVTQNSGEQELAALIVLEAGVEAAETKLKAELARDLPSYMLPAVVAFSESLPRTATGKIDYGAVRELLVPAA